PVMVQEFHVVRCFSCESFQVQQVKKATRWTCKLCGEKQSLLKEFGRGSGADCRRHVQKLNAMRGSMMEEQEHTEEEEEEEGQRDDQVRPAHESRWSKYLDTPEDAEPEEEDLQENVVTERQQRRSNNIFHR
uniref:MRN complex-interacting protein N-terminal domain-containing protein n=1 Tax=Salarias fasciatus TaxID=181472 RepID=A0A672GEM2_SALFA